MGQRKKGNLGPNRGRKNAERPEGCVFCPNRGVSREHSFPEWMHKYYRGNNRELTEYSVAGTATNIRTGEAAERPPGTPPDYEVQRDYPPAHMKFFGPCEECNNNWMSQIEVEAEPVLAPILRDEAHTISLADQVTIAKWATLRAIVNELGWLDRTIISPDRRHQFKDRPGRFATSSIFLGRSLRQTHQELLGTPYSLYAEAGDHPRVPVALQTTILFGPLLIVLFYAAEMPANVPIFQYENIPYLSEMSPHLVELPATPRAPIEWSLRYGIDYPHPYEDIRDWFRTFLKEAPDRPRTSLGK